MFCFLRSLNYIFYLFLFVEETIYFIFSFFDRINLCKCRTCNIVRGKSNCSKFENRTEFGFYLIWVRILNSKFENSEPKITKRKSDSNEKSNLDSQSKIQTENIKNAFDYIYENVKKILKSCAYNCYIYCSLLLV